MVRFGTLCEVKYGWLGFGSLGTFSSGNVRLRRLGHRKAVKVSYGNVCLGKAGSSVLLLGSQGSAGYVAAEWGLARQSGRGSHGEARRGIARHGLSASGALRFGLAVMVRSVEHCRVQQWTGSRGESIYVKAC